MQATFIGSVCERCGAICDPREDPQSLVPIYPESRLTQVICRGCRADEQARDGWQALDVWVLGALAVLIVAAVSFGMLP